MQEKKYFFLSGFISVSLYLVLCASFLLYINAPKTKKFDSLSKETVIELEIITRESTQKTVAKKSPKQEKIVKKSTSRSNKQKANFKSLFANVKTKAKKVASKDVNAVKENSDPSRFKSKFQKQRKTDNTSVSKLLSDVKTSTNKPRQVVNNKGEQHPYFSKISQILTDKWNKKYLEKGLKAKVLVMISNDGKLLSYSFIKYSYNSRYDESLKEFLEEQKNVIFPTHNINNKVDIILNFESKDT